MSAPKTGAEATERLNAPTQAATKPTFDVTAIHARITSNALAYASMYSVQNNISFPIKEKLSPTIMTTNEAGQIRAAVVFSGVIDGRQVMSTIFKGSLAGSDSEALLSLYEQSKFKTTLMKKSLEDNGRWFRG